MPSSHTCKFNATYLSHKIHILGVFFELNREPLSRFSFLSLSDLVVLVICVIPKYPNQELCEARVWFKKAVLIFLENQL